MERVLANGQEAKVNTQVLEHELRALTSKDVNEKKIVKSQVIIDDLDEELEALRKERIDVDNENWCLRKELMREINKNELVIDPLLYKKYK